jgi:hypothetical protein
VDVDKLWAHAVLLEVVVGLEVHEWRQSTVGAHGGDGGSEYSFARRHWPVTQAETHAAITWLGRRLRWTVVALDGELSGRWRRVEQSGSVGRGK